MDKIFIKNLLLRGILGIHPDERVNQQDILINITLFTDIKNAARTDDEKDAVNYKNVKNRVIKPPRLYLP